MLYLLHVCPVILPPTYVTSASWTRSHMGIKLCNPLARMAHYPSYFIMVGRLQLYTTCPLLRLNIYSQHMVQRYLVRLTNDSRHKPAPLQRNVTWETRRIVLPHEILCRKRASHVFQTSYLRRLLGLLWKDRSQASMTKVLTHPKRAAYADRSAYGGAFDDEGVFHNKA